MVASHRVLCTKSHTVRSCLCLTAGGKGAMRKMLGEGYEAVGEQRMQPPPQPCVGTQCSGLKGSPVSVDRMPEFLVTSPKAHSFSRTW